jgi:heme exporter protein D
MSLSEFFDMGGYAMYVWPSYAIAAIVLALNWWLPYQQHKQNLKRLRRQHRQDTERYDARA